MIELRCGTACASISQHGAELRRWSVADKALLWTPDAAIWDGVSPVLFPVVGWTRESRVQVDGVFFPMPVHGFAANAEFTSEKISVSHARFTLRDKPETRAHYPFAFELCVDYRLSEDTLDVTCRVRNTGAEAMPYSIGLHPGFVWPFCGGDYSDYRIVFDQPEAPSVPIIGPGGLFSQTSRAIALTGRELALSPELFTHEALCFINAKSRTLTFEREGFGAIEIASEGFPHWALWSKPGAPFLCIEAWSGHGDPEDFAGELHDKPSITLLAAAGEGVHKACFSFRSS